MSVNCANFSSVERGVSECCSKTSTCCDNDGCQETLCGNSRPRDHGFHAHDHDHHGHDCGNKPRGFDHEHDHDHNDHEDCCGHDHGHLHEKESDDCCSDDHGHGHQHSKDAYEKCCSDEHDLESGLGLKLVAVPMARDLTQVCNLCDPNSPVEHTIIVTRFRVANLCCSGEERLIRTALEGRKGIDHVAVNIIGRYAVLKHCPLECCASSEYVCKTLNALGLGVSVQEVGSSDSDEDLPSFDLPTVLHVSLTIVLFIIGLVLSLNAPTKPVSTWVYIASIIVGILPILRAAGLACFVRRVLDINTLIVVAVGGALASGEYFDGSLVVTLFIAAELLETTAFLHVQKAMNSTSRNSTPKMAYLANGKSVKVDDIQVKDVLAVRTGEMILCDGVVSKGDAVINESSLTGEAKPVEKHVGATVLSGTVVMNGYIEVTAEKKNKDSTIKLLEQAVQDVQAEKGFFSGIVDQFSLYWTPVILIASIAVVLIGGGVTGEWRAFGQRGLVLLVLACPCAIVISAPIPCIAAIAIAARSGVLIKGSAVIERLATISTVTVDKTGTLTKGYFKVCDKLDVREENSVLKAVEVMMLAAALEQKSTHPLASAVVSEVTGCVAEAAGITFPEVRRVKVLDGVGIEGQVLCDGMWLYIAVTNERILTREGTTVKTSSTQRKAVADFKVRSAGRAVLLVVVGEELCLLMSMADEIRPEAKSFVSHMRNNLGLKVKMLTGDQKDVAEAVCKEVSANVEDCHASLLPANKYAIVSTLEKKENERVMMIGDGVNDSTALASATVGVAMGAAGSALAVVNAQVVLMNDNLMLLPCIIKLSRNVRAAILQNCSLAIGVKIMAIVLAVLGRISFWQAIVIDIGTLLVVLLNGIRFLRTDLFVVDDAVNELPGNKISSFPMEVDV